MQNMKKSISNSKIFALVLTILILIPMMAACQSVPESSYEPLAEQKRDEIENAWFAWQGHALNLSENRYYGTHGDCIAIFDAGQGTAETILNVADVKIWYGSRFNIYIYRNGEFAKLADAYENGWLAKKHVQSIAGYHRDRLDYYPEDLK